MKFSKNKKIVTANNRYTIYDIRYTKRGFTLIELLIVCAMIAVLVVVAVVSYSSAKAKARDARRVSDVDLIANAFRMYYDENKTYMISGTGSLGDPPTGYGAGFFNVTGVAYSNISIAQGLVTAGFLSDIVQDPINDGTYYYMFYYLTAKASVYAKLENTPTTTPSGTANATYITSNHMNYAQTITP